MIQFPETASREWQAVAATAEKAGEVRERIERDTRVANRLEELHVSHEAKLMFQQAIDAESTPILEMVTLTEYRNDPGSHPVDLIEGVVRKDGLTLVLGPSGAGKSTIALQMSHSILTGTPWFGQAVTPLSGGLGVASYDMDAGQMLDWVDGMPGLDPDRLSVVNAHRRGHPIGVPSHRRQIAEDWRARGVEVVIIDSFSASFYGHDQNDAAATMAHYRDLKLFALTEVGAKLLIVIVHSTAASPSKARGSSAHHDTADNVVLVEQDEKTGTRKITSLKYREPRGARRQMTPIMVGALDPQTNLAGVDAAAMNMEGLHISPALAASLGFSVVPETIEEPAEFGLLESVEMFDDLDDYVEGANQ